MKRWLIAAVVAVLLSAGLLVWLSFLAASMLRLKAQMQDRGARVTTTDEIGLAVADLWATYTPFVGAAVIALCFAITLGIAALVGRKSRTET
jgi:hypothetical protein